MSKPLHVHSSGSAHAPLSCQPPEIHSRGCDPRPFRPHAPSADCGTHAVRCQAVPRPKSLELSRIGDAALAVIDRDGLAALSMRAVSAELGVGTLSLYRYVKGREELELLVVERVLATVDTSVPARAKWTTCVTLVLERARRAIADHPAIIPLLVSVGTTRSGALLRCGETVLAALATAGFEGNRRAIAFRTLIAYLIGAVQVEHYGPIASARTETLAATPPSDFPVLAETAAHARNLSGDEVFLRGLESVLIGLKAGRH